MANRTYRASVRPPQAKTEGRMSLEMSASETSLTECFICKSGYTDPRLLPCIHTFCLVCLEGLGGANHPASGEIMRCPFCQREFRIPEEGLVGLKKNLFLDRLAKVRTIVSSHASNKLCDECFDDSELTDSVVPSAVQYCVQCDQFLCKTCSRIHRRSKLSKEHCLIDLETDSTHVYELLKSNSRAVRCAKHPEEQLQMFCTDCQMFACAICFDEDHQLHKIGSIKRIADDYQNQLEQLIGDVTNCVTGTEKKIRTLVGKMTDFQRNIDDCERKIVDAIEYVKRLVDAQGKTLLDELSSTRRRQLKLLQSEVEGLETHRNWHQHFTDYCREIKDKSTKNDLCDAYCNLSRRAKELQSLHDSDMQAHTCFVTVTFEKTQLRGQRNYSIIGEIKETAEIVVMHRDIGSQVVVDTTNDTVSDLEPDHTLELLIQDLIAFNKLNEAPNTSMKVTEAAAQVLEGSGALDEPISSKTQPLVELKDCALRKDSFGPDGMVTSKSSEFLYESSDLHGMIDIDREHRPTLDEPKDNPISDYIDKSTANTSGVSDPIHLKGFSQSCVSKNVADDNFGDIALQKSSSISGTSDNNPTGQSEHSNSVANSITETSGSGLKRHDTDNSSTKMLDIQYVTDISVTEESISDKLTSNWLSDSCGKGICKSNYVTEVSQNSLKSLDNSAGPQNKRTNIVRHCMRQIPQEPIGRPDGVSRQVNLKTWLTQTSKLSERKLDSLSEIELSSDDELPDLNIEESELSSSCDSVTSEDSVDSDHEETSSQTRLCNFPQVKYVSATSDIGLGVVMKQFSEAEPSCSNHKNPSISNIEIQPADSTKSSKRKLRTAKPKQNDCAKKRKGDRALELIHRLKTGSAEILGVTYLQNKVYVLKKKSVSIYSTEDPKQPLENIKLQEVISPFDICACTKSCVIYITDFGNYNEDRLKHGIWRMTISNLKVSRWYCGIGEPHTLSVSSEGNVILLRIDASGQQRTLDILSHKAELIRCICLPEEIESPEHALETSTGSFVICHKRKEYGIWTVSEVSRNGEIVRRLKGTEQLSEPKHLALGADDRIFIADWGNNRLAILGARFNWNDISFTDRKKDGDGFKTPTRLCYVADKKQLIVISKSLKVCVYSVS